MVCQYTYRQPITDGMIRTAKDIRTQLAFGCVPLWLITGIFYAYPSGLIDWHLSYDRNFSPEGCEEIPHNDDIIESNQSTKAKLCAYFVGYKANFKRITGGFALSIMWQHICITDDVCRQHFDHHNYFESNVGSWKLRIITK